MSKLRACIVVGGLLGTLTAPLDAQPPPPASPRKAPRVMGAQGKSVGVRSLLPGSPVAFSLPEPHLPARVLIKPHDASSPVWSVSPTSTVLSDLHGKFGAGTNLSGVGFVVPQLPNGIYDAWYTEGHPVSPIAPHSSRVAPANPAASQSISFAITPRLRAQTKTLYGAPGSDLDVAIGIVGPTSVPASTTSAGRAFDPVSVTLTGTERPVRGTVGPDGLAHFRVHVTKTGIFDLSASAPGFDSTPVRIVGGQAAAAPRTNLLQPGDVLLHVGESGLSDAIRIGEAIELPPNPNGGPTYSHAGLYVGSGLTIEMLSDGAEQRDLPTSFADDYAVDVYRHTTPLTDAQRQSIVGAALAYRSRAGGMLYADLQITIFGLVVDPLGLFVQDDAAEEQLYDLGKEKMICSELVAWAYHDAGSHLTVSPWRGIASNGLWTSLEQQMDYTTPTMLAESGDLQFRVRIWPAVLDEPKNADGSCPTGYAACGAVCQVGWAPPSQCTPATR